jgi:hypothetical protein
LILIDLYTEEGVIGRSYLEPYIRRSMRYLIPTLNDLGEMLKGRRLAPIEFYEAGRKSLRFVGYEGMAMIAVAGVVFLTSSHPKMPNLILTPEEIADVSAYILSLRSALSRATAALLSHTDSPATCAGLAGVTLAETESTVCDCN